MAKNVNITMLDNGDFSIKSNVSSTELLGLLELAKQTVIKDLMVPKAKDQSDVKGDGVDEKEASDA